MCQWIFKTFKYLFLYHNQEFKMNSFGIAKYGFGTKFKGKLLVIFKENLV